MTPVPVRPTLMLGLRSAFGFLVLAGALVSAVRFVTGGSVINVPVDSDVWDYFWPHTVQQYDALESSPILPLFTHGVAGGVPAPGSGQLGASYGIRTAVLSIASSPEMAADLYFTLHLWIAATTMLLLGSRIGLRRPACIIASAAYISAPLVVAWAPFFHSSAFFAWFPAFLLGAVMIDRGESRRGAMVAAASLALLISGSHLQSTYLGLSMAAIWVAVLVLAGPRSSRLSRAAWHLGAVAGGILLSTSTWLEFLLLQADSSRTVSQMSQVRSSDPASLLGLVDARFSSSINELISLGGGVTFLAIIWMIAARRREAWATTAVLVICLGIMASPLVSTVVADLVPGWRLQSNYDRISFVVVPMLALQAAFALDRMLDRSPRITLALMFISLGATVLISGIDVRLPVSVALLLVAIAISAGVLPRIPTRAADGGHGAGVTARGTTVLVWAWAVLAALIAPIAPLADVSLPTTKRHEVLELMALDDSRIGRWSAACMALDSYGYRPSTHLLAGVSSIDIYDSFVSRTYAEYWAEMTSSDRNRTIAGGQWFQHSPEDGPLDPLLLRYSGVTWLALDLGCGEGIPTGFAPQGFSGATLALKAESPFPSAWLSDRAVTSGSFEESIAIIRTQEPDVSFSAHMDVIEGFDAAPPSAQCSQGTRALPVREVPDGWIVTVPSEAQGCAVVTTLPHFERMSVRAAGTELERYVANGMFVAFVAAETGPTHVDYVRPSLHAQQFIAIFCPLVLLAIASLSRRGSLRTTDALQGPGAADVEADRWAV